jgi:hypothetical protein
MCLPPGDNAQCVMQTIVTGPGTLSFDWRVDSEEAADFLSVEVSAGENQMISGNTGWLAASVEIPVGEHTVVWRYVKNGNISVGDDRGWVDRVRFTRSEDKFHPVIQDIRVSPRLVDVSGGEQLVEFTIEVTDDLHGVAEGRIELFNPNGDPQVSTSFNDSNRTEGDSLAGTYVVSLPVGPAAVPGRWHAEVELTEATSLATHLWGNGGEPFHVPDSEVFFVTDGSLADTSPPQVRAISVAPAPVDITGGTGTAIVTLRITDPIAGFAAGDISAYTPEGNWPGSLVFGEGTRIAGDTHDGIYQVEVTVPQYGSPGTWKIGAIVRDHEDNGHDYPNDLAFDETVDETFAVANTGLVDETEPVVTSIEITPDTVDVSTGDVEIQITISISDDRSGRRDAFLFFYTPEDVPHGAFFAVLDDDNRIDGNNVTGTYQVTRTIPQGTMPGNWIVRTFLRDRTGKVRFYGPGAAAYPEPGDGIFTVGGEVPSLFEAFLSTYSLTGNDALPGADPDGDGRNNATELMLGTDPNVSAEAGAGAFVLSRDPTHLHYDFTIDSTLSVTVNGLYLELRDGSGGAPLRLTGQTQAGLAGVWTDVLPVHQVGSTWRISLPFAGGSSSFARISFEDQ